MPPALTDRQVQVLEGIRRLLAETGRSPTLHELRATVGGSIGAVHKHVGALEAKGVITRTPHEARSIRVVGEDVVGPGDEPQAVSMLKATGRGRGKLNSETATHPLPVSRRAAPLLVDPSLLPDGTDLDDCVAVVVGDDGMGAAGIYRGDRIVAEELHWDQLPDGALAVALFGERVVARRFSVSEGRLRFEAASKGYRDQAVRSDDIDVFVIGRALAVLRALDG